MTVAVLSVHAVNALCVQTITVLSIHADNAFCSDTAHSVQAVAALSVQALLLFLFRLLLLILFSYVDILPLSVQLCRYIVWGFCWIFETVHVFSPLSIHIDRPDPQIQIMEIGLYR